jgi:two-component system, OmpR family, sensor histidine kinase VicK
LIKNDDHSNIQSNIRDLTKHPNLKVQYLSDSVRTKVTSFLADQELFLVIELKDDTRDTNNEAIGLATYSNSESTVLSYASIFETLWLSPRNVSMPT